VYVDSDPYHDYFDIIISNEEGSTVSEVRGILSVDNTSDDTGTPAPW
jgi:hypothetical protein